MYVRLLLLLLFVIVIIIIYKFIIITNTLCRYLHMQIATSITARGKNWEWCMSDDLCFLYCLAHGLTQYFASKKLQQEHEHLYGVARVTVIACSFFYFPNAEPQLRPTL
ncbi:hypothetical protein Hanom_Chr08g00708421 [Helianthus anomalus]